MKFIGDICAQPTYRLEGDSFLLVTLTDEIDTIAQWFSSFLGSGKIPRKAYDTRDFDEIDLGDPAAGIEAPLPEKGLPSRLWPLQRHPRPRRQKK